ncbi:MAG: ESX secretion-associated protein EspG [Mycobacteriaceae bacterium]
MTQWTLTPDEYLAMQEMHGHRFPAYPLHLRSSFAFAEDASYQYRITRQHAREEQDLTLVNIFAAIANPALRIDISGHTDVTLRVLGCHNHHIGVVVYQLPDPTPQTSGDLIITTCRATDLITRLYECLPSYQPGQQSPLTLTGDVHEANYPGNPAVAWKSTNRSDEHRLQQLLNQGVLGSGYFTVATHPRSSSSFGWIDISGDGRYLSTTHPVTRTVTIAAATNHEFTHYINHLTRNLVDR